MKTAIVLLALVLPSQALAQQSLEDTKDTAEMIVASAYACNQFLKKPEVLEEWKGRAQARLVEAGMDDSEASAFVESLVEKSSAATYDEMQQKVGCEMIDIRVLDPE